MNLSINNSMNSNPNFGMSVLIDRTAEPIIKKQTLGLSKRAYSKFISRLDGAIERQLNNPNNIIIRSTNSGRGLAAEVVDAEGATAVRNYVTAQGLLQRNGSVKFSKDAERKADRLESINGKLSNVAKAEEKDYRPVIDFSEL